jgi:hypothetical protein
VTSSGPQVEGGEFGVRATVAGKGERTRNARWQFDANALFELPLTLPGKQQWDGQAPAGLLIFRPYHS